LETKREACRIKTESFQRFDISRKTEEIHISTKIQCSTEKKPINIWTKPHAANISSLISAVSVNEAAKVSTPSSEKNKEMYILYLQVQEQIRAKILEEPSESASCIHISK
jgi:predicted component of viral defense system (DUF524 family)